MRRCPRCTFTLTPHRYGQVEIDSCPRCHGVFIEADELGRMLGGIFDQDSWVSSDAITPIGQGPLRCPSGHGPLTILNVATSRSSVEIDVCRTCRGVWLDASEAERLRHATPATIAPPPLPVEAEGIMNEPPTELRRIGVVWYLFMLLSGLPVEVYNPTRRRAVVCLGLILTCTILFGYELVLMVNSPGALREFIYAWGAVPAFLMRGHNLPQAVSYMFLHGSVIHLLGNMWFLWTFGDNIEDRVGHLRFICLYLAFGLCALLMQMFVTGDPYTPLIGASGAISGLMGAYLALFPRAAVYSVILFIRWRIPVWVYLGFWIILQTVLSTSGAERVGANAIAFGAHVGGFVAGFAWGMRNRRRYADGVGAQ